MCCVLCGHIFILALPLEGAKEETKGARFEMVPKLSNHEANLKLYHSQSNAPFHSETAWRSTQPNDVIKNYQNKLETKSQESAILKSLYFI